MVDKGGCPLFLIIPQLQFFSEKKVDQNQLV